MGNIVSLYHPAPFYQPYYSGIDITMPSIPISLVVIHNIDLIMASRPVNLVSVHNISHFTGSYRIALYFHRIALPCMVFPRIVSHRIVS